MISSLCRLGVEDKTHALGTEATHVQRDYVRKVATRYGSTWRLHPINRGRLSSPPLVSLETWFRWLARQRQNSRSNPKPLSSKLNNHKG
jgi:hypothetical protein